MRGIRFYASPQFLLFAAVLFFFDSTGLVSAAVPAIAVHELGHVAALHLCGCKIRKFDMRIRAFSMDYSGHLTTGQEIFAAAAGPMAGMIFAAAAHCMGQVADSEFLLCTADISLILSLFNILPAMPLDGGRIFVCLLGPRRTLYSTTAVACILMCAGLFLLARGYGAAMLISGGWLTLYSCKMYEDVVK